MRLFDAQVVSELKSGSPGKRPTDLSKGPGDVVALVYWK
jgi:hypothetical protein